jgi:hypothetical protein
VDWWIDGLMDWWIDGLVQPFATGLSFFHFMVPTT